LLRSAKSVISKAMIAPHTICIYGTLPFARSQDYQNVDNRLLRAILTHDNVVLSIGISCQSKSWHVVPVRVGLSKASYEQLLVNTGSGGCADTVRSRCNVEGNGILSRQGTRLGESMSTADGKDILKQKQAVLGTQSEVGRPYKFSRSLNHS
jgi:hypothetical protein